MDRTRMAMIVAVLLAGAVAYGASLDWHGSDAVRHEFAIGFTLLVVGGLVSGIGLVGMLGQWYAGANVNRLISGGVIVLAGAVVASQAWAAALGLAGVLVAAVVMVREHPNER